MDVRECLNASFDRRLEPIGRLGLSKMHGRLYRRQDVFRSVLGLARENRDLRLAPLVLGNVTDNLRGADDLSLRIFDRRDGQRDVYQTPVLTLADGFVMFDALAAPNALDDRFLFVLVFWRDQNLDVLANYLFGHVAKDSLGRAVPGDDSAIEVLADNCVVGRLNDGCEALRSNLSTLSLRHIHQHIHRSNEDAGGVEDGCWERKERNATTIRTFSYRFHAPDRSLFFHSNGHGTLIVRQHPAVRPEEFPRTAPLTLAEIRPAGPQRSSGLVVVSYAAGWIGRIHRCRKRVDQLPEEVIPFDQGLRSAGDEIEDR